MAKIITKPVTFGGSTEKGKPYDKFKQDIKKGFKTYPKCEGISSIDIKLYIFKHRLIHNRNDLDNFLKPIIDSLEEIKIIKEEDVDAIQIKKVAIKDDEKEGVEIKLK